MYVALMEAHCFVREEESDVAMPTWLSRVRNG